MNLIDLFQNKALVAGLVAWLMAQVIKMPLNYLYTRKWNWALLLTTGGMPSSHSSLMTGTVFAIGLYYGFDNPVFALGVAITMIVTYDAGGVRRQAGIQFLNSAQLIAAAWNSAADILSAVRTLLQLPFGN